MTSSILLNSINTAQDRLSKSLIASFATQLRQKSSSPFQGFDQHLDSRYKDVDGLGEHGDGKFSR